jgi:SNF2 family DNA or RNA helicase
MAHQKVSLKHDKTTEVVYDCSDPGTGKTFVRVTAFAERRRKGGGCALVVAPRSLLKSAWANDFKKFAPDMRVSIARADNRAHAFAVDADVYIVNTDGVKWVADQRPAFFKKFSELIVDEITAFKHHTSQRSKALRKIAKYFKHRSGLTGTPNGRSITDVWHQVAILDGGQRLGPSFYAFRNSVCVPEQVGRQQHMIDWVDKEGAEEAVFGLLSDIVVRHKFEDCVDIPPNHHYVVDFEMPQKMRRVYEQMERDQIALITDTSPAAMKQYLSTGKKASVVPLTALNAAVLAGKLLQIASGAVYDSDGNYHVIDSSRYELVLDMVEQRKHSLVFFLWQHQRDLMVAEAESRGLTYCVLDGATNDKERDMMVLAYQMGRYRVMFAHPKSAAHGLTLTKGTATIWPSPTADLELWKQGNKRQHRIGQTEKTETIVVLGDCRIDQRVYYDILMRKNERMTTLLDLFASLTSQFDLKDAA